MTPAEMREVLLDEAPLVGEPTGSFRIGTSLGHVLRAATGRQSDTARALWHVPGRERVPQQAPRSQSQPILGVEHDLPDHREG
jgi:hypothetical protein